MLLQLHIFSNIYGTTHHNCQSKTTEMEKCLIDNLSFKVAVHWSIIALDNKHMVLMCMDTCHSKEQAIQKYFKFKTTL